MGLRATTTRVPLVPARPDGVRGPCSGRCPGRHRPGRSRGLAAVRNPARGAPGADRPERGVPPVSPWRDRGRVARPTANPGRRPGSAASVAGGPRRTRPGHPGRACGVGLGDGPRERGRGVDLRGDHSGWHGDPGAGLRRAARRCRRQPRSNVRPNRIVDANADTAPCIRGAGVARWLTGPDSIDGADPRTDGERSSVARRHREPGVRHRDSASDRAADACADSHARARLACAGGPARAGSPARTASPAGADSPARVGVGLGGRRQAQSPADRERRGPRPVEPAHGHDHGDERGHSNEPGGVVRDPSQPAQRAAGSRGHDIVCRTANSRTS